MGICSGACLGAQTKDQCLCKAGFTDFGMETDECAAEKWEVAVMGQNTACRSVENRLSVTMTANVPLTTAVQTINIVQAGLGYADGTLDVIEPGSENFSGSFQTSPVGSIVSVRFLSPGRWFLGQPTGVRILHAPGCAVVDISCTSTAQEGTIGRVDIVAPGLGYVDGLLLLSGGGGAGAAATVKADISAGGITQTLFATVGSRGGGYTADPAVSVVYAGLTRCDDGTAAVAPGEGCLQEQTITKVIVRAGMTGCLIGDVVQAVGGGGGGFRATVTGVTPLQSITTVSISNHGAGYAADPLATVGTGACRCQDKPGNIPGNFATCLTLFRANNATVRARRAGGAVLSAVTGSKVIIGPMTGATQPFSDGVPVEVTSNVAKSIAGGTSLSCGFTNKGGLLCWGQSEQRVIKTVFTWACGYSARYYRFRPILMRSNTAKNVQITEFEFFTKGHVEAKVTGVSNPGGFQGATAGFEAVKLIDRDPGTYWKDLNANPVIFDMGVSIVLESYRS